MTEGDRERGEAATGAEEQRDRYRELLEEVRTVMPGTQVLFAFLLTAAFSGRFTELDDLGKRTYAVALLLAALAAIAFMGPAAFHRIAEPGRRAQRLSVSINLQVGGMALLLASMVLVVFVVIRFIFEDTLVGVLFAGTAALVAGVVWYLLPSVDRAREARRVR
jgi:hypothetical protein